MEADYVTSGELALWRGQRGFDDNRRGMAATGIGLGAGLGGAALLAAIVGIWGVNQASKGRADGANAVAQQLSKTQEMIVNTLNREATRNDGINIDVQQSLRSLTRATAEGGSSNALAQALAQAEAMALAMNNNSGMNSAIGGCNYLRVARVSGSRLCGCDTCEG